MDMSMMTGMVEQLFQGRDQVSKQDVENKAQSSGMGADAMDVVHKLPDKMFGKDELMQKISELGAQKAGMGSGFHL